MEFQTSEKMLLKVLSAFANGEERADFSTLSPSVQDWADLYRLAEEQTLFPVVYEMTHDIPEFSVFSEYENDGQPVGAKMCEKYRKKAVRSVGHQAYRAELFLNQYDVLLAEGIVPVVMKGIVVRNLYAKGDHRPSNDEDIWVRDEDFMKAVDIFLREGYSALDEVKETSQEIGFRRADGSYIELHRRPFGESTSAGKEITSLMEGAYDRRVQVTLKTGRSVWTLAPQDHFLYLILHAYKHFIGPGVGIRQVMDIGVFGRTYQDAIDWQALYEALKSIHVEYFTAAMFWICEHTLEIPLGISESNAEKNSEGATDDEDVKAAEGANVDKSVANVWKSLEVDGEPLLHDMLGAGLYGCASMERAHTATITLNQVEADRTKKKTSILATAFPPKEKLVDSYPELKTKPFLLPVVWAKRLWKYLRETKTEKDNDMSKTIELGKERTELLRLYKIIK